MDNPAEERNRVSWTASEARKHGFVPFNAILQERKKLLHFMNQLVASGVKSISATDLRLKNDGALLLSSALSKDSSKVTELDLSSNQIDNKGFQCIAKMVENKPCLKKLILRSNLFSGQALSWLKAGLRTLSTLVFSGTPIGDTGAECIADGLADSSLEELDMENCDISDRGAQALAKAAPSASNLTSMNLAENMIGQVGANSINDMLAENDDLFVNLTFNPCSEDQLVNALQAKLVLSSVSSDIESDDSDYDPFDGSSDDDEDVVELATQMKDSYFSSVEWNKEASRAFMLFEKTLDPTELQDILKLAKLCEAPKTPFAAILLRILWRMICKSEMLEEFRDLDNPEVQKFFRPGDKLIKLIMQGGKTLKGMLLHSAFFAGLRGEPIILFGHTGARAVKRDLTSQVRWIQSIYEETVYKPGEALQDGEDSNKYLPPKLFYSTYRTGHGSLETHNRAFREGRKPFSPEEGSFIWYNIWAGSGDAVTKMLGKLIHSDIHLKPFVVIDEAHLLPRGKNVFHRDFQSRRGELGTVVHITATNHANQIDAALTRRELPVVTLTPAAPSYHCLRTAHDKDEIEAFAKKDIHDFKYKSLEGLLEPGKSAPGSVPYNEFLPKKWRKEQVGEATLVDPETKLTFPHQVRLMDLFTVLDRIANLAKPTELFWKNGSKGFVPRSLLVHNGFNAGGKDGRSSENYGHVLMTKVFVQAAAESTHMVTLKKRQRERNMGAWVLGFPEYLSSSKIPDGKHPGVYCNKPVVDYLEENPKALLKVFERVCPAPDTRPNTKARIHVCTQTEWGKFRTFFEKEEWRSTSQDPLFQDVHKIECPQGLPLQVRKEMMYLVYCAKLEIKHPYPDMDKHLAECPTPSGTSKCKVCSSVRKMQFVPLMEITVGRALLRHSVAVSSLRNSLQPMAGIFAWDPNKTASMDDAFQAVGRMNGRRTRTLHLQAAYKDHEWSHCRPTLYLTRPFENMIVNGAEASRAIDEIEIHGIEKGAYLAGKAAMAPSRARLVAPRALNAHVGEHFTRGCAEEFEELFVKKVKKTLEERERELFGFPGVSDAISEGEWSGAESDVEEDEETEAEPDGNETEAGVEYKPGEAVAEENVRSWLTHINFQSEITNRVIEEINDAIREADFDLYTANDFCVLIALAHKTSGQPGKEYPRVLNDLFNEQGEISSEHVTKRAVELWKRDGEEVNESGEAAEAFELGEIPAGKWRLDNPPTALRSLAKFLSLVPPQKRAKSNNQERRRRRRSVTGRCVFQPCPNPSHDRYKRCEQHLSLCQAASRNKTFCKQPVEALTDDGTPHKYCEQHKCWTENCQKKMVSGLRLCVSCNSSEPCKTVDCSQKRKKRSLFCALHHNQNLAGKRPREGSDAGESVASDTTEYKQESEEKADETLSPGRRGRRKRRKSSENNSKNHSIVSDASKTSTEGEAEAEDYPGRSFRSLFTAFFQ